MISSEKLLEAAKNASENSYSPYSGFRVGAALSTSNDKVFIGCNVENISFGLSMCAERVALFKAISQGYHKFNALAVSSNENKKIFPCVACRQVLCEFAMDLKIYINYDEKTYELKDLLPHRFDSIN
jgi:cytidine deaminase